MGALAAPAAAHPAGPPPSAMLSADGSRVTLDWSSAPDDAATIGVELGLLDEDAPSAYLDGPADAEPTPEDVAALSGAAELHDYLLEHASVTQGGVPCDGSVEPIDDFLDGGATLVFDCPAEVDVVDIELTVLARIDTAYRSFGVSRDDAAPDVAVFTAETPVHTWDFSAVPDPASARLPAAPMVVGALAVAGAVGGGVFGFRRRPGPRRRDRSRARSGDRPPARRTRG